MEKYILNKEDAVIMIIDIQERLVPVMKYKDEVINNNKILIQASKEMDIPIIYTEQYPKGLGHTIVELDELIENGKRFEKTSFSAINEEVRSTLESLGRKKLIITGMETHVCVFQTVRDLILEGYEVFVVKDGVASRTKDNYLNGLELMKDMGAVITNTETIVFDLLKRAGTSEFKTMSKLIK